MGLKNIWSLNIDELLVTDKLKQKLDKKEYEVFFPLNSQLKDIDLVLFNLKNCKSKTIQVKGSRTYTPSKSEREKFGEGSSAWISMQKKSIFNTQNKIDFFIFVLHSFEDGDLKKQIKINYLIIPIKDFKKIVSKKVIRKGEKYHFFIWIDDKGKRAFEFNNKGSQVIPLSKYLNNWNKL
ncbi:hypothetical protein KAI04_02950 [Candidatus Pacearchaeota archaeon]|nr:hypothetical protein [Candidatus Pacearchaeota archaeon]